MRVADVVSLKEISPEFRKSAEMWCGCLAGTISIAEYESILRKCGFTNVSVEVAHIYTKEIISSEFLGGAADINDSKMEALDGAFAGALISADKP